MATSLAQYQQAIVNADKQLMAAQQAGDTALANEILSDINKMVSDMKLEHPDYSPKAVADTSVQALDTQLSELQTAVNEQPVVAEQTIPDEQMSLLNSVTELNDGAQPVNTQQAVVPVNDQPAVNQLLDVAQSGVEVLNPNQETEINSDVPVTATTQTQAQTETQIQPETQTQWNQEDAVIAQWGDGKFIIELPNGKYNFLDQQAGLSTTDPEMIKLAMDEYAAVSQGQQYNGMTTGDRSKLNYYEDIVNQDTFLARGGVFQSGYLFVGEGIDEAYEIAGNSFGKDGEKLRDEYNLRLKAFKETRPKEYMAWKAAGAIYSTLPAMYALPTKMYTWMASLPLPLAAVSGAATGGAFNTAEGAISGWLASDEGQRGEDAMQRGVDQGMFGLMLGGFIPVAPKFLAWGWHSVKNGIIRDPVKEISESFGISEGAAKMLKKTILASGESLENVLKELRLGAGSQAMVGDATEATKTLLDMIAASGNEAAEIVTGNILKRSETVAGSTDRVLNKNIAELPLIPGTKKSEGLYQDARLVAENLAKKTAPAREKAYQKAYNTKINYNSDAGKQLLEVLKRIPNDLKTAATKEANDILQMEGKEIGQMVLEVGQDGLLKFKTQPNMMQLDYIKRALSELAYDPLKVSGLSKSAGTMRYQLSEALKKLNPNYAKALKLGQEKITRENAIEIGENALKPGKENTYAQLAKKLSDKNIGAEERQMVAMGLRAELDRMLGNVKSTASTGTEIQAMKKLLAEFSSKNAKKKLKLIITDNKEYNRIVKELNKAKAVLNLQNAVNINSKTYTRTALNEELMDVVEGGAVKTLFMQGNIPLATTRFLDKILKIKEITNQDRAIIMRELAQVMVEKRGSAAMQDFSDLYNAFKNNAMSQRQLKELTDLMASRLGMKPTVAVSAAAEAFKEDN